MKLYISLLTILSLTTMTHSALADKTFWATNCKETAHPTGVRVWECSTTNSGAVGITNSTSGDINHPVGGLIEIDAGPGQRNQAYCYVGNSSAAGVWKYNPNPSVASWLCVAS